MVIQGGTSLQYVALGIAAVLIPALLLGGLIAYLKPSYVQLIGGVLLLYFGLRLIKGARSSVIKSMTTGFGSHGEFEKGIMSTGFSVGAIEAFEAGVVLVGLLPNSYVSSEIGIIAGVAIVVVSTYVLRNHVRKVKQANMKVLVSTVLLSFSAFWFGEIFFPLSDAYLILIFVFFLFMVYTIANRPVPIQAHQPGQKQTNVGNEPRGTQNESIADLEGRNPWAIVI